MQEEHSRQFREFLFSKQQVKSEPIQQPDDSPVQNIEIQENPGMLNTSDVLESRKRSLSSLSSTKGHEEEYDVSVNGRVNLDTVIDQEDRSPMINNREEVVAEVEHAQESVAVGIADIAHQQATNNITETYNELEDDDKDANENIHMKFNPDDEEAKRIEETEMMVEESYNDGNQGIIDAEAEAIDVEDSQSAPNSPQKEQDLPEPNSSEPPIVIDDDSDSVEGETTNNFQQEDENPQTEDVNENSEIGNPNLSLLLQVAENSKMKAASNGMQILVQATADRGTEENQPSPPFFTDDEAAKMFTTIKDTLAKDPTAGPYFDEEVTVFKRNLEERSVLDRLPKLPTEPQFDSSVEIARLPGKAQPRPEDIPLDVKEPVFLANPTEDTVGEPLYYCAIDSWYPSNTAMKREKKRFKGDSSIVSNISLPNGKKYAMTASMQDRLSNSAEPGAVEKLPHCKIHARMFQAQYGKLSKEPLFCCQVTEIYCNSTMLCCSVCGTWRHAECGGHYTFYSPKHRTPDFVPICDICHKEKAVLQKFPQCEKRLSRQRNIHLRKTLAAADIMRHAAYAKHGGTYKWPLGSVLPIHMGGHSRSVHIRHERAEKQWKEMLNRLNGGTHGKTKERVKQRTKELERVLNNLEEAGKFLLCIGN